jgi:oligopeptide/dipeptide ABC transporter ATP-binding protein
MDCAMLPIHTLPKEAVMVDTNLLVEIKDLHTYFHLAEGVVRAVDGVDMKIRHGETIGVVGESGCGKSVTSLSLMSLLPPSAKIESGEIIYYEPVSGQEGLVDAIDIAKLDPNSREIRHIRGNQISMVFQEPMTAMIPIRTVGQQIMEAITLHRKLGKKEAREMTIDILGKVRMPRPEKVVDDYPFQLSGGMRQRAVIAMALSCHPQLLIADEPTTALDVTTEAQILDLMRSLQNDLGMAIMYITHNLGVVAEMAKEVVVMYLGKIVEQTDVQTIFLDPLHPYTHGLLASIPHLDESILQPDRNRRLNVIKGMVPDPYSRLKGCPFHPRCPQAITDVCDQVMPDAVQARPGHMVRCHLYTDYQAPKVG